MINYLLLLFTNYNFIINWISTKAGSLHWKESTHAKSPIQQLVAYNKCKSKKIENPALV